ncbi:MAG: hypothetical protein DWQ37_03800 [Planctomycetota bacterium]|mgnify:CR=1 FL=1|nr:MAG: hypothetical protein DWQ37_03800 [Planctomycetota bacterium]
MQKGFLTAFAVTLIFGLVAQDALAGPRGRGGGRRGNFQQQQVRQRQVGQGQIGQQLRNGAVGENLRNLSGQLQSQIADGLLKGGAGTNLQDRASQLKTNFKPGQEPFTPAWYAQHPNAWRYTHPHADAWAVATFATAAAWLGIAAVDDDGYYDDTSSVYTGETDETDDSSYDDQASQQPVSPSASAAARARARGDYLPLGVFAVAPQGATDASAMLQLAVDKQGTLRGNYYDVLTGNDQSVTGTVDKQTQAVNFQLGSNGKVRFKTSLVSLTQPQGKLTLNYADGRTSDWVLARFDQKSQTQGQP